MSLVRCILTLEKKVHTKIPPFVLWWCSGDLFKLAKLQYNTLYNDVLCINASFTQHTETVADSMDVV